MKRYITVIDDSEEQVMLIERILRSERYEVFCISDETQACDHLIKHPPHVILLDMLMPKINGLKLLASIRKIKHLANIPVLVFSGINDKEVIHTAMDRGVSGYVLKPVDWKVLLNKLKIIFYDLEKNELCYKFNRNDKKSKGVVSGTGAVMGLGETNLVFASDYSFNDNITLSVNSSAILEDIHYGTGVLKPVRSQGLSHSRYRYKTKCILPGVSESCLQHLRKWMYKNCQRKTGKDGKV
ncbi:MAG: response regulator [Bacteriovoracaceae bacterium]|nr:response regulator [Bacteriovoracaceae bacterium]